MKRSAPTQETNQKKPKLDPLQQPTRPMMRPPVTGSESGLVQTIPGMRPPVAGFVQTLPGMRPAMRPMAVSSDVQHRIAMAKEQRRKALEEQQKQQVRFLDPGTRPTRKYL